MTRRWVVDVACGSVVSDRITFKYLRNAGAFTKDGQDASRKLIVDDPFHDKDILVSACGRICMPRKKINVSTVLAGQKLGIKEVDDGIWLVSFMTYDLGYIGLEQKTLQIIEAYDEA